MAFFPRLYALAPAYADCFILLTCYYALFRTTFGFKHFSCLTYRRHAPPAGRFASGQRPIIPSKPLRLSSSIQFRAFYYHLAYFSAITQDKYYAPRCLRLCDALLPPSRRLFIPAARGHSMPVLSAQPRMSRSSSVACRRKPAPLSMLLSA